MAIPTREPFLAYLLVCHCRVHRGSRTRRLAALPGHRSGRPARTPRRCHRAARPAPARRPAAVRLHGRVEGRLLEDSAATVVSRLRSPKTAHLRVRDRLRPGAAIRAAVAPRDATRPVAQPEAHDAAPALDATTSLGGLADSVSSCGHRERWRRTRCDKARRSTGGRPIAPTWLTQLICLTSAPDGSDSVSRPPGSLRGRCSMILSHSASPISGLTPTRRERLSRDRERLDFVVAAHGARPRARLTARCPLPPYPVQSRPARGVEPRTSARPDGL